MEPKLQRRIQRYGWDLAAPAYEPLWQAQLAGVQAELLAHAGLAPGQQVLDVASGTGLVAFAAANAVGQSGRVCGIDLSGQMVEAAQHRARSLGCMKVEFARMDAECLTWPDASFDVVLCALGLMYMPDPELAVREMRRVLRPGGRVVIAVWGERAQCGWSSLFGIVDAEVSSDVCPLFFRLGQAGALRRLCAEAGLQSTAERRITASLAYGSSDDACDAALAGGPVALAWSRFDDETRTRVRDAYLKSIEAWRIGSGYDIPAEFVVLAAARVEGSDRVAGDA